MAPLEEMASLLSSVSSTGPDEIKIELRFGGHWEKQADGSCKYVGGEKYWEKVPSKLDYASLMHRMSAKINGAVILKYLPPGEDSSDPENLVTCIDNDHVQEMLEEYWKAKKEHQTPGKTFRLQMWLYNADEEYFALEDIEGHKRGGASLSSNHSSASAGTGANQENGRKLSYTLGTISQLPTDVEMQQKEAQQMVTWMAEQEEVNEANWQAHLARNLYRAHECTYDSFGWPHDRSPFLKVMGNRSEYGAAEHQQYMERAGSLGVRQGSSRLGALSPHLQPGGTVMMSPGPFSPPSEAGNWRDAAPMEAGPNFRPEQPLAYYTQDPYKEELSNGRGVGQAGAPEASRAEYYLPSLLGSDVGNAGQTTLGTAEKAHIEHMVAGMVQYALQDGSTDPPPAAGPARHPNPSINIQPGMFSGQLGDGGLQRTPSRLASYDHVYRIPQDQILVVDTIGEGTFGEVVLATNEVFGKIAVKWLKPAKMDKHKTKFWEEARMLAALNHPNVLRFYGVVTASPGDQNVVGIMTEFMNGSSLSNYLRSGAPRIPLRQRAELAREAVNGLSYLHAMNIVHFDLKPDNLLLDRPLILGAQTPGVKVADFGLSKQKFRKYVSGVRDLRGTLPYMAPELVSDPDHVSESADVWSLGIVFWEMLAMETPFQHLSPQGIITGLMMGQLRPEIPEDCEPVWLWLLEGCLNPNPADRLTLRDIGVQLDRIIQKTPPMPFPPQY